MKTVIVLNANLMGSGNDALGQKLIGAFLKKLWARQEKPTHIILYNSAVKLMTKEGNCLDVMNGLQDDGVDILGCGTCIDAFAIGDQVEVGMISNMEEIVNTMFEAEKVITI